MDRISNLPDDLICIIVSFLLEKSAASRTILSKKWLNLFTVESDLVFDLSKNNGESFQNFIDGLPNRPASCRIRRFSLKLKSLDNTQFNLVNGYLSNVLKRGVMDLELNIKVKKKDKYSLLDEVFTCKTVEKVKLGSGFIINMIHRNALLPALKTLILNTVRFGDLGGDCEFNRLLSASPVIKELVVYGFNWNHWKWSRTVSSQTLERLTLRCGNWHIDNWSKSDTMSFDTPNLTYLEYSDTVVYEYPIFNLNSLVKAKLNLTLGHAVGEFNLINMIKGLKNVQILRLSIPETNDYLFDDSNEEVPFFENLIHISVTTEPEYVCWYGLRVMLEKSPNLETLTIKGYLHSNTDVVCECLGDYSFLLTCPIKVLKITKFAGDLGDMVHIKHVLEKLCILPFT